MRGCFFSQRGRLNTDKTISQFLQRIVTSRSVISGAICVVRGHILTGLQQRIISRFQRLHARAELNLASKKKRKPITIHPSIKSMHREASCSAGRQCSPAAWRSRQGGSYYFQPVWELGAERFLFPASVEAALPFIYTTYGVGLHTHT